MAEQDTKELDDLLDSVNGSAERFQTLWFSFLGLTLYLAIAALATTHRNLLLGEAQTLPILNIKVELLPFYVIAPLFYLVFHFYLLMMLLLLARTAAEFDKLLRTTHTDEADRERYRAKVDNALFLQLLVGMKGERSGVNAFLLGLIALITIVLAPLATLILMQMMFLPYHDFRITWWHRGLIVADLALILSMTWRCFYPRGVRKAPLVLGALGRKPRWATAMAFCVLLAAALAPLGYWLSFKEGRWAGEPQPSAFKEWQHWMAGEPLSFPEVNPDYAATANGVVFGLFPDRLKLDSETIVGEKTLNETKEEIASRGGDFVPTIKLDGRDLHAAVLSEADLRGVSLKGATMSGAKLRFARLDGASLTEVDLGDADLSEAHFQGAVLVRAQLQGADLSEAQMQGADLSEAQMQGAHLGSAQLQGADIYRARLQGADLGSARLQGTDLRNARLQGAVLFGAELQGADLSGAELLGANLGHAQLQGANLSGAQLQGTVLFKAQLQGADLSGAELLGADLGGADMSESEIDETFVFGADMDDAHLATAAIRSARSDDVYRDDEKEIRTLSPYDVKYWIADATDFVREKDKENIAARFARLEPKPDHQEVADQPKWGGLAEISRALDPDGAQYRRRLADRLSDLACDAEGAPYVARGLVRNDLFSRLGDHFDGVRNRLKNGRNKPETCPGVAGFTEGDWRALEAIKPAHD
jgi:uncharacterized protein YjbI with pentapeptide repeats